MSKDCRITVRMSEELGAWVHEQAQLGEQDDAAFVRMVLSNLRRGGAIAPVAAKAAPTPQAIVRDVLDVASAPQTSAPAEPTSVPNPLPQGEREFTEQAAAPFVDVDAMVDGALDEAEAQGLTEPQIEAANGQVPEAGVRPLLRRPTPYARGTQHARLEQMFGGI